LREARDDEGALRLRALLRDGEDALRFRTLVRDFAIFERVEAGRFAVVRERAPVLRDLLPGFLADCRFAVPFELVGFLTIFRRVLPPVRRTLRRFSVAFAATAPATPPIVAPIGPATLPMAAPATAPAVCFGIGGISISSEDCEVLSFC